MKPEVAKVAARWWADQLRGNAKLDNGDDSEAGIFGSVLSSMLQEAEKSKRPSDDADKFEVALVDRLLEEDSKWLCVGVDYHPDGILQSAADRVGVQLGMASLPWKTNMRIENDTVRVSCGYRSPIEQIYPQE